MSRHLRWTLAITERLVRRMTWRGIHPEDMTLSLAARFWILLREIAAGRPYPAIWLMSPRTRELHEPTARQFPFAPDWKPQFLPSRRMTYEALHTVAPIQTCIQNRREVLTAETLLQRVFTMQYMETSSFRESSLANNRSERNFSLPSAPLLSHRTIRRMHSRLGEDKPDIEDISARVRLRHCRVEQPLLDRDSADQPPSVRIAERPVVVDKSRVHIRARAADELSFGHKPRGRASPAEPPVNIGHITDAVLQQLDRRLVAARERMGRI